MKLSPFRRRGIALIALSSVFFAIAARPHSHAFLAIGVCFLAVGLATLRRAKRGE